MPFDGKKIAPRTYEVILSNLDSGEYGFLLTFISDSDEGAGSIGKWAFRVAETLHAALQPGVYKATFSVAGYSNSVENVPVGPGYPATVNSSLHQN